MAPPMKGSIDRRAARTRNALRQALIALILRKGYEAITIQDLIDEADVGRSTFYSHFTSKSDLLRGGFQSLREDLAAARTVTRKELNEPLRFSLAMFEHASGYRDVYRALLAGRGGGIAVTEIRRILSEFVRKEMQPLDDDTVPKELRVEFVVGTFLTVIDWWMEKAPGVPPTRVDSLFRQLVMDGIRYPR